MQSNFIRRVSIDWDAVEPGSYLLGIPALRKMGRLELDCPVTFFTGENGSGKSTLLEAIAVAYGFNPEGGTLNFRFSTYDEVSRLSEAIQLSRGSRRPSGGYFFRAESFFNLASKAEDYRKSDLGVLPKEEYYRYYGGRALHEQSHGESFLAYFQGFDRPGLYLMDEPEASLSPQRQLVLLARIYEMSHLGAQFLIASHSPILLGMPEARLFCFEEDGVHPCCYEETESYQITRLFLDHRKTILEELLKGQTDLIKEERT